MDKESNSDLVLLNFFSDSQVISNKHSKNELNNFICSCCCFKDEQMLWCHQCLTRSIYCWLSRCSTANAKGFGFGLSLEGPTKVKAYKLIFPCFVCVWGSLPKSKFKLQIYKTWKQQMLPKFNLSLILFRFNWSIFRQNCFH